MRNKEYTRFTCFVEIDFWLDQHLFERSRIIYCYVILYFSYFARKKIKLIFNSLVHKTSKLRGYTKDPRIQSSQDGWIVTPKKFVQVGETSKASHSPSEQSLVLLIPRLRKSTLGYTVANLGGDTPPLRGNPLSLERLSYDFLPFHLSTIVSNSRRSGHAEGNNGETNGWTGDDYPSRVFTLDP